MDNNPTEALAGLIIAVISSNEVCIDINDLYQIINPAQAEDFHINVNERCIILNGEKVLLFDLFNNFPLMLNSGSKDTRIIILERNQRKICLFVDNILEIITINRRNKNQLIYKPLDNGSSFIEGKIYYGNRSFHYPNVSRILNSLVNDGEIPEKLID